MKLKAFISPCLFFLLYTLPFHIAAQQGTSDAFRIYDEAGNTSTFQAFIDRAQGADVIFIGELHDDPIAHWLQRRTMDSLIANDRCSPMLGMEMLERDQQVILNEFLSGLITEDYFLEHMRLWPNYQTDYHPMVLTAREHEIPVYATNIPRRYANGVYRSGPLYLDSLSNQAGDWIPQPYISPDTSLRSYGSLMEMGAVHGGSERLLHAQAVKDALMAEVIAKHYRPDRCFLHLNGAFHSDYHEGIVWYLNQLKKDLDILTMTTVRQKHISTLDDQHTGKADFILCVPDDMTKTH